MRKVAVVAIAHPSMPHLFLHGKRRDNDCWSLPGGHAENGEYPIENARRELREETGLRIKELEEARNGGVITPEGSHLHVHLFTAKAPEDINVDAYDDPDEEFSEFKFLDPTSTNYEWHIPQKQNILLEYLKDHGLSKSEMGFGIESLVKARWNRYHQQLGGSTEHEEVAKWTANTFNNDNHAQWFLRNYKQDNSIFTPEKKTEMEHFAGMMHIPQVADVRFDPSHDFESGLKSFGEGERAGIKASSGKGVAPKGRKMLELDQGWSWWNLGTNKCTEEATAMSHCGNTASRTPSERILSLRRTLPTGKLEPHLTFIDAGDGYITEAKGKANTKPKEKYHDQIMALAHHKDIIGFVGGGYLPSSNFEQDDLHPDLKDKLNQAKPNLFSPWLHELPEHVQEDPFLSLTVSKHRPKDPSTGFDKYKETPYSYDEQRAFFDDPDINGNVLASLAKNPALHPDFHDTLGNSNLDWVRQSSYANSNLDPIQQQKAIDGGSDDDLKALARNKNLHPEIQQQLIDKGDTLVLAALAYNENIHPELQKQILSKSVDVSSRYSVDTIVKGLAKNMSDNLDFQKELEKKVDVFAGSDTFYGNPKLHPEIQKTFAESIGKEGRGISEIHAFLTNPSLTPEVQESVSSNPAMTEGDFYSFSQNEKITKKAQEALINKVHASSSAFNMLARNKALDPSLQIPVMRETSTYDAKASIAQRGDLTRDSIKHIMFRTDKFTREALAKNPVISPEDQNAMYSMAMNSTMFNPKLLSNLFQNPKLRERIQHLALNEEHAEKVQNGTAESHSEPHAWIALARNSNLTLYNQKKILNGNGVPLPESRMYHVSVADVRIAVATNPNLSPELHDEAEKVLRGFIDDANEYLTDEDGNPISDNQELSPEGEAAVSLAQDAAEALGVFRKNKLILKLKDSNTDIDFIKRYQDSHNDEVYKVAQEALKPKVIKKERDLRSLQKAEIKDVLKGNSTRDETPVYKMGQTHPYQSDVIFEGMDHALITPKSAADRTYEFKKSDLKHILDNWGSVAKWTPKQYSRLPSKQSETHTTTISEKKRNQAVTQPMRKWLDKNQPRNKKILYHGVGQDTHGARALEHGRDIGSSDTVVATKSRDKNTVHVYDPFHPNPHVRTLPDEKFDHIHSHFTMNVTGKDDGKRIFQDMHDRLTDDGTAVISTRGDLKGDISKRPIGKPQANTMYVHKDYVDQSTIGTQAKNAFNKAKAAIGDYDWQVVSWDKSNNSFNFKHIPKWDTEHEPPVEKSVTVFPDGTMKHMKDKEGVRRILHGKWQFVGDDYKGFDIEKDKQRHYNWSQIVSAKDKPHIGRENIWNKFFAPYIPHYSPQGSYMDHGKGKQPNYLEGRSSANLDQVNEKLSAQTDKLKQLKEALKQAGPKQKSKVRNAILKLTGSINTAKKKAKEAQTAHDQEFKKSEDFSHRKNIRTDDRVFVAMDGDNIGASVERAAMADDLDTIIAQSQVIALGQHIIRVWGKKHDADIYIDGGDDIAMTLPIKHLKTLETLRIAYQKATGFTVTIGVGDTISHAGHAMLYGKLHGKNQINEWSETIEDKLNNVSRNLTPEEKYREEGLLKKEILSVLKYSLIKKKLKLTLLKPNLLDD